MTSSECPDLEVLDRFASDSLDAELLDSVTAHLSGCDRCRQTLADIESNVDAMNWMRRADPLAAHRDTASATDPILPGYEIIKVLSRGGQGIVYEAVQRSTSRRVAIKFLLHGTHAQRREQYRFEREVDLAASLHHPNIVTIHDSGITSDGRAFYVMRFVEGTTLGRYLGTQSLSLAERLGLFFTIVGAVRYAHQRGVIHRDLKPANILIDDGGCPNLLDFGLAKSTNQESVSVQTRSGEFLGTLAYASPEQVSRDPSTIDVRSDVYALGVILYEMLTGAHPYRVDGTLAELINQIATADPLRPSSHDRSIDEDLDTIVLKALNKDPDRRYQSAHELLNDIERYLDHRPIEARADSRWYVLRKTVRRHALPFGLAAAVVVSLAAGLGVSIQQAIRASYHAHDAEQQAEAANDAMLLAQEQEARAVATLDFVQDMLSEFDGTRAGKEVTLYETVQSAEKGIDTSFQDQPDIRADLHAMMELIYQGLQLPEEALAHGLAAGALYEQIEDSEASFKMRVNAGVALLHLKRVDESIQHNRALVADLLAAGKDEDDLKVLTARNSLGMSHYHRGDYSDAISVLEEVRETRARLLGPDHRNTLITTINLAVACERVGREEDALRFYDFAIKSAKPGNVRIVAQGNRAIYLTDIGRLDEGIEALQENLDARIAFFGEDHPSVLRSRHNIATAMLTAERYDEALGLSQEVYADRVLKLGEDNPETITTLNNIGVAFFNLGEYDRAIASLEPVVAWREENLGPVAPLTLRSIDALASAYRASGETVQAAAAIERAVQRSRQSELPAPSLLSNRLFELALCYEELDRAEEAVPLLVEAFEIRRDELGLEAVETTGVVTALVRAQRAIGRLEDAAKWEALLAAADADHNP